MYLIFCTSPFQVLVAKEIIKSVGGDFHGIYFSTSDDIRHAHYSKDLESVCSKFSRIDYGSAALFLDTFEELRREMSQTSMVTRKRFLQGEKTFLTG